VSDTKNLIFARGFCLPAVHSVAGDCARTFAEHFESQLQPLGEFTVRGFGNRQTVFGLADET
jgi:hypothetical protein